MIFSFQSTANIGLLKEGGKVKSYKNYPGHTGNLVKVEVFIGRFVGSCLRQAQNKN